MKHLERGILNVKTSAEETSTVVDYDTAGTYNVTVPTGCIRIILECWGGGGAGGGASNLIDYHAGSGGAGGAYAKTTVESPTPGHSIQIIVANSMSGTSAANGNDGNYSRVQINSVTLCLALGGPGGKYGGVPPAGSIIGSIGDIRYRGGDGGVGEDLELLSGGGGGGAGTGGNGGDAIANLAGTGTADYGGTGGAGRASRGNGLGGSQAGGGGGGALSTTSNQTGGTGGRGRVRITYVSYVV